MENKLTTSKPGSFKLGSFKPASSSGSNHFEPIIDFGDDNEDDCFGIPPQI